MDHMSFLPFRASRQSLYQTAITLLLLEVVYKRFGAPGNKYFPPDDNTAPFLTACNGGKDGYTISVA
jgi:hypothetical protein